MAKQATVYDIVLSCPGDVIKEKEIIQNTIDYFNKTTGEKLGIVLMLKHWSTDSYSQSGAPAQEILNRQFIEDADMIIGILANRMGTPTKLYKSGTSEEIQEAIEHEKQVFLYFSNVPVNPNDVDLDQKKLVNKFREKVQEEELAYYKQYESYEDFGKIILSDLTLYFLNKDRVHWLGGYSSTKKTSNLVVKSVDGGKPSENIKDMKLSKSMSQFVELLAKDILDNVKEINELYIPPIKDQEVFNGSVQEYMNNKSGIFLGRSRYKLPVNINQEISDYTSKENIELSDNFYELGKLEKVVQPNMFGGGSTYNLEGTENEENKYELLISLYNLILRLKEWETYAEEFSSFKVVPLCLANEGTIYETEITVKIKINKNSFVEVSSLQPPGPYIIEEIIEGEWLEKILGSVKSSIISEYDYGMQLQPLRTYDFPGFVNSKPNYDSYLERYRDHLDDIKDYELFEDNDSYILEYYFKELKHHTAVSFPNKNLINDEESVISYQIISRENPNVVEGEIRFE